MLVRLYILRIDFTLKKSISNFALKYKKNAPCV